MTSNRLSILSVTLLVLAAANVVNAQSIVARPSARECELDEVITISVEVLNPKQASTPEPPTSAAYSIQLIGGPSTNMSTSIINGRRSDKVSYTYIYELVPKQTGIITVGPFVLKDSGKRFETSEFRIAVKDSVGPPDLFCRIISNRETIFVGEPVQLTLEVWIRQYSQQGLGTLSAEYMIQRLQSSTSDFGLFGDAIKQQAKYRPDKLEGENGRNLDYYVFIWESIFYPSKPGPLSFDNIQISASYPTRLRRTVFNIEDASSPRRLRASPEGPDLLVKATPLDGRPDYYTNAIGQFSIRANAAPHSAAVGDPITLNMTVSSTTPLDGVSAPRISKVKQLTDNFEVTDDSLAGKIVGNSKTFSVTIRPLRDSVEEIPAIPFSYFDPTTERYETVWSDPIPLDIRPAERITVPPSPETESGKSNETELSRDMSGLMGNRLDSNQLLKSQHVGLSTIDYLLLGGCPILFVASVVTFRPKSTNESDAAKRRRSKALAEAKQEINRNGSENRTAALQRAILGYVADVSGQTREGMTRGDAVAMLRKSQISEDVIRDLDQQLDALESARYAGNDAGDVVSSDRVISLLSRVDRSLAK